MSDQHKLLQETDQIARQNFDFDPRVAFQNESKQGPVPTAKQQGSGNALNDPAGFQGIPEGSHTDARVAQEAPKMNEEKRQVVVDASLRDWTQYPNPQSNLTFAFGDGALDRPRLPVQTNNPTYPSFALPPTNNPLLEIQPGSANKRGFSQLTPNGEQVDLSAQNSSLPKGNFVAQDTSLNIQNNAGAFGCPLTPSNVVGLRLTRAVLPQTPFVAFPTDPVISADLSDSKAAATAKPQYTFATNPYLLMFVNDQRGNYQAPSEPGRKSFAVLAQDMRPQIDFTLANGPQQFDYKPWNQEVLRFQSPLTSLQKLQITVTDPQGNPFATSQPDNMEVESIRLATLVDASGNITATSRATLACITNSADTQLETQLRVGDSIVFHTPTLSNIIESPTLRDNQDKKDFTLALIGKTLPVLAVKKYTLNPETNQQVPSASDPSLTDSTVDYFNVFFVPNFTVRDANGVLQDVYSNAVDNNEILEILNIHQILGDSKTLPFLNTTLQPVYTFELDVLTPDTTHLGGKPVF